MAEHGQTHTVQQSLIVFFDLAGQKWEECPFIRHWMETVVNEVPRRIEVDGAMSNFDNDLSAKGNALVMTGDKKRKRTDCSFKLAISSNVLKENRAINTQSFLRAHPDVCQHSNSTGCEFDML